MNRSQLLLAALTLTLGAVIGGLVVFVVMNTDNEDEPDPPGLSRDLTAQAGATSTATPAP